MPFLIMILYYYKIFTKSKSIYKIRLLRIADAYLLKAL